MKFWTERRSFLALICLVCSVYQQVIEKTDDLSLRSYVLITNLKQYAQVRRSQHSRALFFEALCIASFNTSALSETDGKQMQL